MSRSSSHTSTLPQVSLEKANRSGGYYFGVVDFVDVGNPDGRRARLILSWLKGMWNFPTRSARAVCVKRAPSNAPCSHMVKLFLFW